ncbi:MAG: cysteine-rich CWC family protein [Bacteroidota bacterium]
MNVSARLYSLRSCGVTSQTRSMSKHEDIACPRCGSPFECKVGDINHCQCTGIQFTEAEYSFILQQHTDCLCINCLRDLKQQFHQQGFAKKIKDRFGNR